MLASQSSETFRLVSVRGGLGAVPGVRCSGVAAGIKPRKRDLALIDLGGERVCAAVITTNDVKAAPLLVTNEHLETDGDAIRAIVANSGCANACTGERGMHDARETASRAAALLGIRTSQVLVASTGVIGVPLPMDAVADGLEKAVKSLYDGTEAALGAAEAIMTTDHVPKLEACAYYDNGSQTRYVVGGIAKGSGMIAPNMATMLAFIATDATCSRASLQSALAEAVDDTFNMISVDGDMSTNDCVYVLAKPGTNEASPGFRAALHQVCRELAFDMVKDGEGASKALTVHVTGARDKAQARAVARAVINSSLVKSALFGEDPNWGRIIAAAGSAGTGLREDAWSITLGSTLWVDRGAVEMLSESDAHNLLEYKAIDVGLDLGMGNAEATGYGCDLTLEYVRINAHYRT
ncbi:MAG: bifunctional glutamate N-acetyltransferase/amino-acid acetyltransferase ArgJ [Candidatus Eremiobacteraeota bacterium]|nr:bifunctional glutamate N-acetyltransferase/amino-acid acetyltransferase ArgJ [Candidatus Eremiobacteraeota bacterium]